MFDIEDAADASSLICHKDTAQGTLVEVFRLNASSLSALICIIDWTSAISDFEGVEGLPEYLYEGVDLAGLCVPVEEPPDDPELGEGGDQSEGGDQGQRPVLQDELLQLGETVGGEDVVEQEV